MTRVFFVVGEESGDQLGAPLMAALKQRLGPAVEFAGTGGERMAREGLQSLFPLADIAVMGITGVIARLPTILRRIGETVEAALAFAPDIIIAIDSPDFTHRVAKRVHAQAPNVKIVKYVSPSVWAWRPGRARKMKAFVDHILAILPFEPAVHVRLGGPPCSYVGHPLIERIDVLRPAPGERQDLLATARPRLLVLPGSRMSEIKRLMAPLGQTLGLVAAAGHDFEAILPAVSHLRGEIEARLADWPVKPLIVDGEAAKFAAFRSANAALAASGTVTLELALSGVPEAVVYKTDFIIRHIKWIGSVPSIVLPNLVLGENVVPEFVDDDFKPEVVAGEVAALLADTPARRRQLEGFSRLDALMRLDNGEHPSDRAAGIVMATLGA